MGVVRLFPTGRGGDISRDCPFVAFAWLAVVLKLFRGVWDVPVTGTVRCLQFGGIVVLGVVCGWKVGFNEARWSNERVLNELSNNGPVALVTAAWTHHLDFEAYYQTIPMSDAQARVRRLLTEPNAEFLGGAESIRRKIKGDSLADCGSFDSERP